MHQLRRSTHTPQSHAHTQESVEKLKAKLQEAADVYVKDKGTLSWTVLQDPKDKTKFALIERYEDGAAVKIHASNPVSLGSAYHAISLVSSFFADMP
jgi:hypothetical protein